LARIILAERYGAAPEVFPAPPDPEAMLESADAALLIGDAALKLDPVECGLACLDLGEEWATMTGLPMVFAVWAGRREALTTPLGETLMDSAKYGLARLDEIVSVESPARGLPSLLVEQYLTRHIQFLLGPEDRQGMQMYLRMARAINQIRVHVGGAEGVNR
jgi:predicted solute-binding protein